MAAVEEPEPLDTTLSPTKGGIELVGTEFLKWYSNDVNGRGPGPWRCSSAAVRQGNEPDGKANTKFKHT
jgi:hypothetical protein